MNSQDGKMYTNEIESGEDLEEDLYILALQKRLYQMKKDRKKAEQDAGLLKNRLNLLKGEEDKVTIKQVKQTWKKVENTRKQTQQKLANMQKQEDQFSLKQQLKEKKDKEIELQKEINYRLKVQLENSIKCKKDEKDKLIKFEANVLKEQRKVLCFV